MGWFAHDPVDTPNDFQRVLERLPLRPPPIKLFDVRTTFHGDKVFYQRYP